MRRGSPWLAIMSVAFMSGTHANAYQTEGRPSPALECPESAGRASVKDGVPDFGALLCRDAEKGDANAQFRIGASYLNGRNGFPQDLDRAVSWFRKAAEQGDRAARGQLKKLYFNGQIMPRTDNQSGDWWRKLVELAEREAKTTASHRTAAERGNATEQVQLGLAYLTGLGVPKDRRQAEHWFGKATDQGRADAGCMLAVIRAYDVDWKVPTDSTRAVANCREAADQGYPDGQFVLGFLYFVGLGVPTNQDSAAVWFRKAAEQGRPDAQYFLGAAYETGRGMPRDDAQAVIWYRHAAEHGSRDAWMNLNSRALATRQTGHAGAIGGVRDAGILGDGIYDEERDIIPNLRASELYRKQERRYLQEQFGGH